MRRDATSCQNPGNQQSGVQSPGHNHNQRVKQLNIEDSNKNTKQKFQLQSRLAVWPLAVGSTQLKSSPSQDDFVSGVAG